MSLVLLYAIEFGYQNRGTKPKTRPEDTDTFPWYIIPKIVWISALKNIIMLPFKVLCTETGQVWLYPVDQDMYGWRFRLLFGFGTVESSNILFSNSECTLYSIKNLETHVPNCAWNSYHAGRLIILFFFYNNTCTSIIDLDIPLISCHYCRLVDRY